MIALLFARFLLFAPSAVRAERRETVSHDTYYIILAKGRGKVKCLQLSPCFQLIISRANTAACKPNPSSAISNRTIAIVLALFVNYKRSKPRRIRRLSRRIAHENQAFSHTVLEPARFWRIDCVRYALSEFRVRNLYG